MFNPQAQYGALIIELEPDYCYKIITACQDPHGPTSDRYRSQALEQDGKAVAAFPCLEAGNWYCQPSWLSGTKFYLITVFPGAVTRLVL